MRSTVPILAFLVLLHLTVSQFYVPGRAFNSYQIQITNTAAPGTDLTASDNGTLFTIPLNDVHDNVNHFAVAFAGYSNPSGSVQISFELIVVGNTSTQFTFSLGVYGVSAIRQLNFALILIGNEGVGAIEAVTKNDSVNLYEPSFYGLSSAFTYTTSVSTPVKRLIIFSGFKAKVQGGDNMFYVHNYVSSSPTGQSLRYYYRSGHGTRLTWATSVLLVYNSAASVMAAPNFVYSNLVITSFTTAISSIQAAFPANSFLQGYNQKCLLGLRNVYTNLISQELLFDLSYPAPGLNYSITITYNYYLVAMCYLEYYNCSLIDPQCIQCQTRQTCSECSSEYYLQLASNNISQCFLCRDALHGCLNCSDSANCTACDAPYVLEGTECRVANCLSWVSSPTNITCTLCNPEYFLQIASNNISQCFLCRDSLHGCLNCLDSVNCTVCDAPYVLEGTECRVANCLNWVSTPTSITCTLCIDGYYFQSSACILCSDKIPNCLTCSTSTGTLQCLTCQVGYYSLGSVCVLCSISMPNCLTCSSSAGILQCLTCEIDYKEVIGGCTDVVGCTSIDPITQLCLSCNPSFQGLSNNVCQCSGRVVNGICSATDPGCVAPYFDADGQVSCSYCNGQLMYETFPVNRRCVCRQKYHFADGQCSDICGDGFNMGGVQCDDGNTVDGDGCSSSCSVEVDYKCSKGSQTSASACIYVGEDLRLNLTRISKNGDLNQGLFSFAVEPPLLNIGKMDLGSYLQLNCSINETVSDITYNEGELTLTVDFSVDLEGMPCSVTLAFDPAIVKSSNITFTFDAVSETQPLRIVVHQNQLHNIQTIIWAISYTAIMIFFLSLGHKMIGAELITNLQIICLSNAFYHKFYFFFDEVRKLEPVTGFWSMFHQEQDSDFSPPFSERVDMTPFFLENSLIVVAVLMPAMLILLLFKDCRHNKTTDITEAAPHDGKSENPPTHLARRRYIATMLYRMIVFPLSGGFMLVLMLSCNVQGMTFLNSREPTFPSLLSSVAKFFTMLILSNVFFAESIYKTDDKIGLTEAKGRYIPLFLLRSLLITTLIFWGAVNDFDNLIFWIVGVQGLYFLIVVFGRPYKMKFDKVGNIGVILLQATTLYAVGLPLAMRFTEVSEIYEYFLVLVLQGMILVAMALSLIRLLIHYLKIVRDCLSPEVKVNEVNEANQVNEVNEIEENPRLRNKKPKKFKKRPKRANKPEALQDLDEMIRQLLKASNPYSLYQNSSKGIRVAESQNQTKQMKSNKERAPKRRLEKIEEEREEEEIVREERGMKMIREEKEEEAEDPELAACKQRLREDLHRKRQKERKL